jgi:uncharacterized protein (TIGR02001 family)
MEFWKISRKELLCFLFVLSSLISSGTQAEWHGNLTVLSDYIHRGYTKNRGNPLLQGHIDFQDQSGWFAGLGITQISFDDRQNADYANVEIKPFLGWNHSLTADLRAELSVTGYIFDGHVFGRTADYAELYSSLHFQDWLSATVSVAPDAYQREVTVLNYELNYRRDMLDNLRFSLGLGYYQANALLEEDYFYWNAGATWFLSSYLALDLRYVDVHLDNRNDPAHPHHEFYPRLQENKFLFAISVGF